MDGDRARPPEVPGHTAVIEAHAAALGISERTARHHVLHRDGLEAAVMRPQQHAHYVPASDLPYLAAILAEALVHWHCFIDGNKRTAWTSMCAFLAVNGAGEVHAAPVDAVTRMVRLTTRQENAADLARWLRPRLR